MRTKRDMDDHGYDDDFEDVEKERPPQPPAQNLDAAEWKIRFALQASSQNNSRTHHKKLIQQSVPVDEFSKKSQEKNAQRSQTLLKEAYKSTLNALATTMRVCSLKIQLLPYCMLDLYRFSSGFGCSAEIRNNNDSHQLSVDGTAGIILCPSPVLAF